MKYELENFELTITGEVVVKLENVSVEYNVEELAQFATNLVNVIAAVKEAIRELTPVISGEIDNAKQIKHVHRMEEMEMQAKLNA
jgi:hypothetical protein